MSQEVIKMRDVDPEMRRVLDRAAPSVRDNVEADLGAVLDRAQLRAPRRRWLTTAVAAAAALALSVPVFLAGVLLERQRDAGAAASQTESPQDVITAEWGGTLVWTASGDVVRADSEENTLTLPSDLNGGLVSPTGAQGGVYTFRGEVPPGDDPVIWYPDGTIVEVQVPVSTPYDLTLPTWAPAGQHLAAEICTLAEGGGQDCRLILISAADGSTRELTATNTQGVSWSPDGSEIAYVSANRALSVIDVSSGATRELLALGSKYSDLFRPSWSPDGAYVAVVSRVESEFVPLVLDLEGRIVASAEGSAGSPPELAWRPASATLVSASEEVRPDGVATRLESLSAPDWTPMTLLQLEGQTRPGLLFSPGGDALLLHALDEAAVATAGISAGTPFSWTVLEVDAGNIRQWDLLDTEVLDWGRT